MVDDSGISYGQALENAIGLVRGKWTTAVLLALASGPLRVGDLLAEVSERHRLLGDDQPLSYKVLRHTLKPLIDARLVVKHQEPTNFAATSWYELTTHGKSLLVTSRSLVQWYHDYHAAITAANAAAERELQAKIPATVAGHQHDRVADLAPQGTTFSREPAPRTSRTGWAGKSRWRAAAAQ